MSTLCPFRWLAPFLFKDFPHFLLITQPISKGMKTAPIKSAILILSFSFNSCTRAPLQSFPDRIPATAIERVSPVSAGGCYELMRGFLPEAQDVWFLLSSDPKVITAYNRQFRHARLDQFEKDWLLANIKELPDDDEFRRKLRSAIFYARTLSPQLKMEFYDHLAPWVQTGQKYNSSSMRRFLRHYARVTKFEKQMYEVEMRKLIHIPERDRIRRSSKTAFEKTRLYEQGYYRCMNAVADPKQVSKEGLKRANTVALGITFGGAGSALVTYGATNYDQEKDAAWWGEIAFVIVTSMAMGYVNSKWILANPKLSMWTQRFPLVMAASAVEDIGVTALWTELLGKEPPTHEEVKKLLADEKFQEQMQAFLLWLETQSDFEAQVDKISALFQFYQAEQTEQTEQTEQAEQDDSAAEETLLTFDPEQIDIEETMGHLVSALSEYEYEQKKGVLSLGSEDYDRYAFHRGIDLIYQPAFIIASSLMYGSLCANPNPKVGLVKAISIFMAINLAADGLYFVSRRGLINQ